MALRLGDMAPNFTAQTTDCIVAPAVSGEDAAKLFPRGARKVKPCLRYTPQPNRSEAPVLAS